LTLVALAAGVCLGLAPTTPADDNKSGSDQQFVTKAGAAGLAEVNLGNMAVKQSNNAAIRKFGQRMVDDHRKANKELIRLANKKRYTLPATMDRKHQDLANRLARLKGDEFNRAFMTHMLDDHKEAVDLFSDESKNGKDSDLKSWAGKTLPTLKEHLKMARSLAEEVKGK
jgi:putative membrane protein